MIVKTIKELKILRNNNSKKKIGLCHGVFDVLHEGHINHLHTSKNFDILFKKDLRVIIYIGSKEMSKSLQKIIILGAQGVGELQNNVSFYRKKHTLPHFHL